MRLVFEQIRTGGDRNFGYLIGDRDAGVCVLVDPSYSPTAMVDRATAQGLTVSQIHQTPRCPTGRSCSWDRSDSGANMPRVTARIISCCTNHCISCLLLVISSSWGRWVGQEPNTTLGSSGPASSGCLTRCPTRRRCGRGTTMGPDQVQRSVLSANRIRFSVVPTSTPFCDFAPSGPATRNIWV